jgi:hypothetical protein
MGCRELSIRDDFLLEKVADPIPGGAKPGIICENSEKCRRQDGGATKNFSGHSRRSDWLTHQL